MAFLRLLLLLVIANITHAFQNLIPGKFNEAMNKFGDLISASATGNKQLEDVLIDAIRQRLGNSVEIRDLIERLECSPSIKNPSIASEIYGNWRLLYTTNTGTSSPIQRKAVDSERFPIYQDIIVTKQDERQVLMVKQIVQFNRQNKLSVDAIASTTAYPLAELTARKSDGTLLGINVLGVSLTGDQAKPKDPNQRIDFVFDEGNFVFGKIKIPYPVPFRLPILRDWVKGWIDVTYLSKRMRISRGNKGTIFVLLKEA